ncbi:MAG: LPS assembly lipoprotein LptE [Verrucomicrobiae bacterium]|nr:LPS assembly lipoprotein LptE [Verrucomicrobiae bacterium]
MKSFPLLIVLILLAGCGYQVGPTPRGQFYPGVKKIFIPVVKNQTFEPRIQVLVTDTIIREFQKDGSFEIGTEAEADAILIVNLRDLTRSPLRFAQSNVVVAQEYELLLRGDFEMKGRDGKVLSSGSLSGRTTFYVGNDLIAAQQQALPLAAENLGYKIASHISEQW